MLLLSPPFSPCDSNTACNNGRRNITYRVPDIHNPLFPAGTSIVPKPPMDPLMFSVIFTVVVPVTDETKINASNSADLLN
jgi:hypothetical protein